MRNLTRRHYTFREVDSLPDGLGWNDQFYTQDAVFRVLTTLDGRASSRNLNYSEILDPAGGLEVTTTQSTTQVGLIGISNSYFASFEGSLIPSTTCTFDVGSSISKWRSFFANNAFHAVGANNKTIAVVKSESGVGQFGLEAGGRLYWTLDDTDAQAENDVWISRPSSQKLQVNGSWGVTGSIDASSSSKNDFANLVTSGGGTEITGTVTEQTVFSQAMASALWNTVGNSVQSRLRMNLTGTAGTKTL
jgi:hypothetical protein